ncbi:hypothetical protein NW759_017118 [Fusarium solani]|nr:hypothetical protein NW759_017118 [Fusarium solani]
MSATQANRNAAQSSVPQYWLSQSSQHENTDAGSTLSTTQDAQYLLLCVNTKNSTVLAHVEVGSLTSDQYMFQQIHQEYQRVREEHEWRISMIIPSWFKTREFPPEAEVRARRYLYEPVPMEDVELADIPLPHLLKRGPHTDKFWITMFPKKLREQLVRRPGDDGQRVIGWGIRVNESLNWAVILLSILIILIGISVGVIVYAAITSDNSSAFGLGAFLVALFTIYFNYRYFAWKEGM